MCQSVRGGCRGGLGPAHLERLSAGARPEGVLLAYQTVVRDYLPDPVKARYLGAMARWVASEPTAGPRRIWIELEIAPEGLQAAGGLPMALDAHLADGAGGTRRLTLARCSYHPDALAPDPAAVSELVSRTK
jgi:hypothetical protein